MTGESKESKESKESLARARARVFARRLGSQRFTATDPRAVESTRQLLAENPDARGELAVEFVYGLLDGVAGARPSVAGEQVGTYQVRAESDSLVEEDDEVLPDHLLQSLEWLAESAEQSRAVVASALRTMDEVTARGAGGGQV